MSKPVSPPVMWKTSFDSIYSMISMSISSLWNKKAKFFIPSMHAVTHSILSLFKRARWKAESTIPWVNSSEMHQWSSISLNVEIKKDKSRAMNLVTEESAWKVKYSKSELAKLVSLRSLSHMWSYVRWSEKRFCIITMQCLMMLSLSLEGAMPNSSYNDISSI